MNIMEFENEINFNELRNDLLGYIGTAINTIPIARNDLLTIMNCSDEELLLYAQKFNFDINNYIDSDVNIM